jgi:putative NADPH-quinone reductase
MKKLIIMANPNKNSFCSSLADVYCKASLNNNDDVKLVNLCDLKFDPVLHFGYEKKQPLELDLVEFQIQLKWAEHIVWIYPNWWGGSPAILKGLIDRTFLPGFAFQFKKGASFPEKLLTGKTSEIILTLDTPPWYYKWIMFSPGLKIMKSAVLEFCGIKLKRTTLIGPVINSTTAKKKIWLKKIELLA